MKIKPLSTILLLAVLLTLPFGAITAKPGGTYKGQSKLNATTPDGGGPMTFDNVAIKLRLPNGKGKVRGTLFTTQAAFAGDVAISGRITKAVERRGGLKHILKGRWSWALGSAGFPGTASGKCKIIVKGSSRGYKFQPPARVNVTGTGFKFTSKVSASK